MATNFEIDDSFISEQNQKTNDWVAEDYEHLGKLLRRQNVEIEDLVAKAEAFCVAIPSWGVGTGGSALPGFPARRAPRRSRRQLARPGTTLTLTRYASALC